MEREMADRNLLGTVFTPLPQRLFAGLALLRPGQPLHIAAFSPTENISVPVLQLRGFSGHWCVWMRNVRHGNSLSGCCICATSVIHVRGRSTVYELAWGCVSTKESAAYRKGVREDGRIHAGNVRNVLGHPSGMPRLNNFCRAIAVPQ